MVCTQRQDGKGKCRFFWVGVNWVEFAEPAGRGYRSLGCCLSGEDRSVSVTQNWGNLSFLHPLLRILSMQGWIWHT